MRMAWAQHRHTEKREAEKSLEANLLYISMVLWTEALARPCTSPWQSAWPPQNTGVLRLLPSDTKSDTTRLDICHVCLIRLLGRFFELL